ncbi:hypothetical protein PILCRDRAFT_457828 [Piloderma croceum F 1598]|uniref:F-box domain-containing protein n=1 Tax=Piloderma croceum (strain F 1598) TaxID=765440 RepID=A0A0C3B954_PILCF|nr:hypothetical protein PILCRDRAFT_457828 [Piloderma croceum F 1598]
MSSTQQPYTFDSSLINVHPVLTIPELLDSVFSFLDHHSNGTNACVCKAWSNVALPVLWCDVDLWRLVSLLVPLKKRGDSSYELVRTPQPTDWIRFSRYAPLVRRLHYDMHSQTHKHLHHSIFNDIARTRLQLNILPNLSTLDWITGNMHDMEMNFVFMHEQVKQFVVCLPFDSDPRFTNEEENGMDVPYLADVAFRMPYLTHLDLQMNFRNGLIITPLTTLLSLLTSLQTLILPESDITSQILTTVSRLPNLGTITFPSGPNQGLGFTANVSPTLTEGAFPSLWNLSLIASMHDMWRFFEMQFMPTNLTNLSLHCRNVYSAEEVRGLLKCVADGCQMLKALLLFIFMDNDSAKKGSIIFEALQPLLVRLNLTEFSLFHDCPIDITQNQIEMFAVKWPSLEAFILYYLSVKLTTYKPTLTLLAILPFLLHCPNLRELGLFISASTDFPSPIIFPSGSASTTCTSSHCDIKRFEQSITLFFGFSDIQDEGAVALFLSRLYPLGFDIECEISLSRVQDAIDDNSPEELTGELKRRVARWDEVVKMLAVLTTLRMEERERCRALEREVEDLRSRIRTLTDVSR